MSASDAATPTRRKAGAEPVRAPKTSTLVANQLRRMIIGGELLDGESLQPTNELLARFGVSRPTLREAFRILESENLVRVTQGSRSGVRIYKPTVGTAARFAGQTLQATGATLGHLYEAQLAFEPFAARVLAERRDARDILKLRAHLAEITPMIDRGDSVGQNAAQARFHQLLVDLTGNKVLSFTAGLITNVLEQHHRRSAEANRGLKEVNPEFRRRGARSMSKLVRLIEAGDGPGAEAHWREHLVNSSNHWLSIQDPHELIDMFG